MASHIKVFCYLPVIKTPFMKKVARFLPLYLVLLISSIHPSFAQTVKNIFDGETPITYLGIDFSQAKVFGETATAPTDMRDNLFPAINNSVINHLNKYDIAGALQRQDVASDLGQVNSHNRSIAVQQIKTSNVSDFNHLNPGDIDKLVSSYDFAGKTGIGLLLVVDGMSKLKKAATIYVTFINMTTKRVLLTERLEGNAGGFGFRNYWAKPIEDVIKKIKKTKYKEWKEKYDK